MTEKRFALAYETNDQNCIWWAVRDGDITLWKEEVVGLLNELHEENKQLRIEKDTAQKQHSYELTKKLEYKSKLIDLKKENEQLRKDVARYCGNFREMEDVKCELAEENKRLKNEIETYKSGNALLKKTLDKEWK